MPGQFHEDYELPVSTMDGLRGDMQSLGSQALDHLPARFSKRFRPAASTSIRISWRNSGHAVAAMPQAPISIPGVKGAGRTPSEYPQAAILRIDRETMDAYLERHEGSTPAVDYALGSVMMYGFSKTESMLGLEQPDAEDYKVGMGVSNGPLQAWMEVAKMAGRRTVEHYILETGVRLEAIVPMAEVPDYIPVV